MSYQGGNYWSATRHPWSCVLFVLPLLLIYETGLHLLGLTAPESLRNGADVWMRAALEAVGITSTFAAPVCLVLILIAWGLVYRENQARDRVGVWVGMTVESAVFGAALFGLSRGLWPFLDGVTRTYMSVGAAPAQSEPVIEHIVRYIGAGIYEETLFRLLLFAGLVAVFRLAEIPTWLGTSMAAIAAALLFAAAHNVGPGGEPFLASVFVFRTLAGVYFALVYFWRGFGIAVGAHAGYDVLVGVLMR